MQMMPEPERETPKDSEPAPLPTGLTEEEKQQLIAEHTEQAKIIARRIFRTLPQGVQVTEEDLIQEGFLGLMDAAEKFDPSRGILFRTYAEDRIRGAIIDSMRNLRPVGMKKGGLVKRLRKTMSDVEKESGREVGLAEAGIEGKNLGRLVETLRLSQVALIELPSEFGEEPEAHKTPDRNRLSPEQVAMREDLHQKLATALESLPKKQRVVVYEYYVNEKKMDEIGKILDVNESRVSQLHTEAMENLRKALERRGIKSPRDIIQ